MTKSELIHRIAQRQSQLLERDVETAVKMMLDHMAESLAGGGRIEIRRFGSFTLPPRAGRTQSQDRDSASCEVRGLLQAGEQTARTRQS